MKKIGYLFFALIFNLARLFPVKEKKIVLFNGHNHGLNGNLKEIKDGIERRAASYRFILLAKHDHNGNGVSAKLGAAFRFFFVFPYHMATAAYIFMNDNFLPLGYCIPSKKTKIIQLWHGAGAFKKFGLSVENNPKVRYQVEKANTRVTHLFVTSKQVIPIYEEAFAIPKERIYATGIPIMDVYGREKTKQKCIQSFYAVYPNLKGKKLLLYTPTFRKTKQENEQIMKHFPIEELKEKLGKDWVIGIKMHPKYPVDNIPESEFCLNLTEYPQIIDLFFVSDILVTDYSSTVVEYALLEKPIIMYAYDLQAYDRGFYFDYESKVPGVVARTKEELLRAVTESEPKNARTEAFVQMEYGSLRDKALDDTGVLEAAEWHKDKKNKDHEKQSAYDDRADSCTERILDCLAICNEKNTLKKGKKEEFSK